MVLPLSGYLQIPASGIDSPTIPHTQWSSGDWTPNGVLVRHLLMVIQMRLQCHSPPMAHALLLGLSSKVLDCGTWCPEPVNIVGVIPSK